MSTSYNQDNVVRTRKAIAALEDKIRREMDKESHARKEISSIKKSITKNTSPNLRQNKEQKMDRLTVELARIQKAKAGFEDQLAHKTRDLYNYEQRLSSQQEQQQKRQVQDQETHQRRLDAMQRHRQLKEMQHHRDVTSELDKQAQLHALLQNKPTKVWLIGSFWGFLLMLVAGVVWLMTTSVANWWALTLAFFVLEITFVTIGAFILRSVGDLSEQGFLQLIEMAFKFQLKGIRGIKEQDITKMVEGNKPEQV